MAGDPHPTLSHLDQAGRARMVDVGAKPPMRRRAIAECAIRARPQTLDAVLAGQLPKGEALSVARVAGIQAAKRTDAIIPLCHTLPLDSVAIDFERCDPQTLRVSATVSTTARTGVEMEALTGAAVAALTVYDMTKAIDREIVIDGLRLVEKTKTPLEG